MLKLIDRQTYDQPVWNVLLVDQTAEQASNNVLLLQYFPQENKIKSWDVDPETEVKVIGGYQEYQLRAVYPLLKIEKKSDHFIRAALSQNLKVILDEVWPVTSLSRVDSRDKLKFQFNQILWSQHASLKQRLLSVGLLLKLTVQDAVAEFGQVGSGSLSRLSQELSKHQTEYGECSVAVINTTKTNHLGRGIADFLGTQGFRVVRVEDNLDRLPVTQIIWSGSESKCQALSDRIAKSLPSDKVEVDSDTALQNRAEIVIFLGEDL